MKILITGEKVQIPDEILSSILEIEVQLQSPLSIDITCFGLDEQRKLADERYMIFYNQTSSPSKEILMHETSNQKGIFLIDMLKIPAHLPNLVFTATIDGEGTMSQLTSGYIVLKKNGQPVFQYEFTGKDFQREKAIIISEVYYNGKWRIYAVGKGFNGGLSALLQHFGGEVAEEQNTQRSLPSTSANQQPISLKKIALEKKLEKQAPKIFNLAKKAKISLEKAGLNNHDAKVALCLDISGSMDDLYDSGKIQVLAERILALGTRFDDDGAIDIFLFGEDAHDVGNLTIDNFNGYVDEMLDQYDLEGGTYYGKAMKSIREHYFGQAIARKAPLMQDLPVYVMFVTDGEPFDERKARKEIQDSSYEPIFWQFMAIGESNNDIKKSGQGKSSSIKSEFTFLEELDVMEGRFLDNANFFSINDPSEINDNELYDLLLQEYPQWVKKAKLQGLLK